MNTPLGIDLSMAVPWVNQWRMPSTTTVHVLDPPHLATTDEFKVTCALYQTALTPGAERRKTCSGVWSKARQWLYLDDAPGCDLHVGALYFASHGASYSWSDKIEYLACEKRGQYLLNPNPPKGLTIWDSFVGENCVDKWCLGYEPDAWTIFCCHVMTIDN